jgi:hypothetical protein
VVNRHNVLNSIKPDDESRKRVRNWATPGKTQTKPLCGTSCPLWFTVLSGHRETDPLPDGRGFVNWATPRKTQPKPLCGTLCPLWFTVLSGGLAHPYPRQGCPTRGSFTGGMRRTLAGIPQSERNRRVTATSNTPFWLASGRGRRGRRLSKG